MQREPEGDLEGVRKSAPWEQVVADAVPCDHIVQLYQEQDFLNRAVVPVRRCWSRERRGRHPRVNGPPLDRLSRPRLEAEGVDVRAAQDTRTADGG